MLASGLLWRFLWITITSALDKEWMIDGRGINNVCDVLMYLEEDDTVMLV
ncbi:inner membrane protein [Escherichia coli]|uniref:Inner membrane protein n=1 Tax=Escherichia coli TaxID=562 RepID=A0A2X1Q3X3_ECOLX|nr:inner membrane protein [Escherichia coli]